MVNRVRSIPMNPLPTRNLAQEELDQPLSRPVGGEGAVSPPREARRGALRWAPAHLSHGTGSPSLARPHEASLGVNACGL